LAYVADGAGNNSGSFVILDVSDPTSPVLLSSYNPPALATGIAVRGDLAFVTTEEDLLILDVGDPSSPTLRGLYNTGDAEDVFVADGRAYLSVRFYDDVGNATGGSLWILDVNDPSSPVLLGSYASTACWDVDVAGNLAYVAADSGGLEILDVSDPASPTLHGSYDTPGVAYDVCVVGTRAYVADGSHGLQVLDVSDPTSPTLRGSAVTADWAAGVHVVDRSIYVAAQTDGLRIFRSLIADASVDVKPDILNLKSTGLWVTCYIELSPDFGLNEVNTGTLLLNGTVAAAGPTATGDYDSDGIPDLRITFPRTEVFAILPIGQNVAISVSGTVADSDFVSVDRIGVVDPEIGPRTVIVNQPLQFSAALIAEGLTGPVTYSAENLPAGATLDPTTGWFQWTPTPDQVGDHPNAIFRAADGLDAVVDSITITVVEASTRASPAIWDLYR
jgi:hypothetical protein